MDSSTVGGKRNPTKLYEVGSVGCVAYGPDTTKKELEKTAKTETTEKVDKPKDEDKKEEGKKEEGKKEEEKPEVDESQLECSWVGAC